MPLPTLTTANTLVEPTPDPSSCQTDFAEKSSQFDGDGSKKHSLDSHASGQLVIEGVYELEWDEAGRSAHRRAITSPEALRSAIEAKPVPVPFDQNNESRQLIVIHGLPRSYVEVLAKTAGVDRGFIEAHVGRRGYRPSRRRLRGELQGDFVHYDYPELVRCESLPLGNSAPRAQDMMADPPVRAISPNGDAVMFCRASLWSCAKARVLFLDRLLWKRPYSGIHKACYSIGATKETEGPESGWELELGGGDETPCLDGLLSDKHILDMGIHDRTQATAHLLGEAVLDQWSEFFDTLSSSLPSEPAETTALFWQVQQCLERNLACSIFRSRMTGSPHSDAALWEPLLERVKRQVALLGQLTPSVTDIAMPSQEAQASQSPSGGGGTQGGGGGLGGGAKTPGSGGSDDDEHKRALDRLSYLGGVLLPFSIIPGILSLADPFGPTNNLFWVFWVITIPLVILTLIVIYADSIRKSEVWIEVAAATASEPDSTAPVAAEPNPGADPEKGEGSPAPLTGLEPSNRLFPEGPSRQKHTGPPFLHGPRWPLGPPQGSRVVVEPEWYSKLSPEARRTMWEKKELGWLGACKTLLRVYRLQDMQESADKVKGAEDVDEFPTVVPKKTRSFPF